ncbi:IS110 family transposase [Bradyrhizobium sp. CCBAU 53380]|uniref:IS110 family transposase n=1 Tax=Bradyrhizobium sp. CCBAU 53380 TaxID=1325117 RepID=UPI0023023AC7|nr:IS110 family transposase [Bradyrhizobium sp. CCBAU 53380]MDA9421636.1 transposase [Bradyrhizobium sp. CCBAU 53380]
MEAATIGLDISKHVFHIHAVDDQGQVAGRQRLRRGEIVSFFSSLAPCLVGIEACATAHHWAREIRQFGHDVRLIPPAYVKPYLRRGAKNDAADAAAICEAVSRPNMWFVPIKSAENQGFLMLHRARGLLVRQRTMTACAIRAHFAEFGIIVGQGRQRVDGLVDLLDDEELTLPAHARIALAVLVSQLKELDRQVEAIERELAEIQQVNPMAKLLSSIPGIGPITATALAATVPDATMFRSGREFAAWLGLTPKQNSTGGKDRLGRITKQGDSYLRHLLVIGARNVVRYPKARSRVGGGWIEALLERRRPMVVAIAVANKLARIVWAMMTTGEFYRPKLAT